MGRARSRGGHAGDDAMSVRPAAVRPGGARDRGRGAVSAGPAARRPRDVPASAVAGIAAAYRDAISGGRLAWASPAVAVVGAYVGFWALGLLVTAGAIGDDLPVVLAAAGLGLIGLLGGLGLGWRRPVVPTSAPVVTTDLALIVGLALLAIGLVSMVAYSAVHGRADESRVNSRLFKEAPICRPWSRAIPIVFSSAQ